MKKQLLRSLALIGGIACALTASAEKRYLQVTSESQLQTGGQYVIGVVGINETQWQSVNPLCYTLSDDNTQINFVSKPALNFTDKMVWTATVNTAYTCAHPHTTNTNPVIDLGMGHKVLQLAQNSNALCFTGAAPSVGVVSAASSNIEFVPCPTTIGNVENDYVFQLHVNPSSTTHFQNICGISNTGVAGAFTSRNDNAGTWLVNDLFNGKNPLGGLYYSSLHRVYLVIDSDNLSIAANALWKSFQEEETAGTSEAYAAIVNAVEIPSDLTGYSINTIETELKKVFKRMVVAETATTAPTADKFYRIISANPDLASHNKNLKGIYVETNGGLRWKDVDFADNTFVWVFEPKGNNKYALRSATTGKYVSTVTNNQQYTTQIAPQEVTLVVNADNKTVRIDNPLDFHCMGHGGGANDNGNIIGWGNANNNPSIWYIQEVQDETSIRDFCAAIPDSYSDVLRATFANQISILSNRDAGAADVVNALYRCSFPFEGKFIKIKSPNSGKYFAVNGNANGTDMPLVDATTSENANDFIFYYGYDQKLRHLYSQKSVKVDYKICDRNDAAARLVNISAATATANKYYLRTVAVTNESARYAHDSGTYVNRCAQMGNHESTHTWAIEEATTEELATLANSVNAPLLSSTNFTEGTEPGQVCIKEDNTFDADFAASKQAVADNFTIEGYDALWETSDQLTGKYTVVPMVTGRYYRFKASEKNIAHNNLATGSVRYLSSVNGSDNRMSFATSATSGTVFYFSDGFHLISAETGRYVVNGNNTANDSDPTSANDAGFIKMATATIPASSNPTDHKAQPLTIDAANAIELGAYKIRFGTGNLTRSIHLSASATGGSANSCSSAGASDYAHNFYVEQVNTLPIEIHAIDNCGTAYFPVAVTVPEGYSVFTGEVNTKVAGEQETLVLTEQPSRIIPAYTPAFITGAPGVINVTIDYTAYTTAPSTESPVSGHYATMGLNADRGILMVKLTAPNENDETVAALNASEDTTAPTARFHKAENAGSLAHNTVVIEANEKALLLDDSVSPSKELNEIRVPLGNNKSTAIKSNVKITTGISQIEIRKADGTSEVFDLQGRRLSKPAKGINIINGRKVLVK